MQIDRSWTPTAYATSPTSAQRQQQQQQNQFYARPNYIASASFDHESHEDALATEPSLGIWTQGNKRVRPSTYDPSSPDQLAFAQQQLQYGQANHSSHIDLPFSNPSSDFGYSQAPSTLYSGYQEYAPVGGLPQALPGGEQHITQTTMYDPGTPQVPGSERGGTGHSSMTSPASQRPEGSYGLHDGYTHPDQMAEQTRRYNGHPSQSMVNPEYALQNIATESIAATAPGYAATTDMSDPHYSYVQSNWNHPTAGFGNSSLYGKDASLHLKLQSLSILDNLSTQIILSLAKPSLSEIEKLTNGDENEESQAYITRKDLFDQTRKVYSRDVPFIDAVAIQLFTPPQQDIIRKANKATFISSILQSHDVSFYDLNEYFLEIFVPSGQRLLKWQGGIFLELKTQVYISALLNSDGFVTPMLDELFPNDLEERITARHPDAPNLAPSEIDFVERARARKQYLQLEPLNTALTVLPQKYEWQNFLKEFLSCISKNVEVLLNAPNRTQGYGMSQSQIDASKRGPLSRGNGVETRLLAGLGIVDGEGNMSAASYSNFGSLVPDNAAELASRANANHAVEAGNQPAAATKGAKTSSGAPRQPWKSEEEEALMAGLEAVKGPHWSQILSLYGRGGSISEILKDRNQIQLKDKARNLKLYYLKMGEDVPACLQGVTGELRKRGGARVRAALGLDTSEEGAATGTKRKLENASAQD